MAQVIYTEAVATVLTAPILTTTASSMSVLSVDQMPAISGGDWFYLTLFNNDVGTFETVKVTDITLLVLTIERAQDGTTAQTFTVSQTTVNAWVVGPLWEDLRTEANETFSTPEDIANAIEPFLIEAQIQALIDGSLLPYITTVDANTLVADFQDEIEIQALIDTALLGYTTTTDVTDTIGSILDLVESAGVYQWTLSASGTDEYYLTLTGGLDPALVLPSFLYIDYTPRTQGVAGSLVIDTWDFADNDTLGFATIYVRLSVGGSPALQTDGYVQYDDGGLISDQVIARQLQSGTQVDALIQAALTSAAFLSIVNITDNGEAYGILAGDGTVGNPMFVDWNGRNPALLDSIPFNNDHRVATNNPHAVSAEQVGALTTGTPTLTFTPTLDYHPAPKKYVDDSVASASREEIDTSFWYNDTVQSINTDIVQAGVYRWRPSGGITIDIVQSGIFEWTVSGSGTNEFYVTFLAGLDPSLVNPDLVEENGNTMGTGVVGSLNAGEWAFADNDALGFTTVYVRLTDNVDPETKIDGYVKHRDGVTVGEYYVQLAGGGNPLLAEPDAVFINAISASQGTIGSLATDEWDYGDGDALGYSTVYARITGDVDPESQADGYIQYIKQTLDAIATRTLLKGTPATEVFQYGWIDHGIDINTPTERFRRVWIRVKLQNLGGNVGGGTPSSPGFHDSQGEYVVTIPIGTVGQLDENALILNHPPTDVKTLIDATEIPFSRTRQDMSLYVSSITANQITFHLDNAIYGYGLEAMDLFFYITYSGVKTV